MSPEPQPKIRLIKRYANRKMYDTERSCYITLEEVSAMVRAGEDVQVIDNKTKEDLTEVTLTQALLDGKRKKRNTVGLVELRRMISTGSDFLQRSITEPVSRVQRDAERTVEKWRSEAEKTVDRVLHRGDEDGDSPVEVPPEPPEPTSEAEVQIDARVRHLFANLAGRLQARSAPRDQRIASLEARIEALEARCSAPLGGPSIDADEAAVDGAAVDGAAVDGATTTDPTDRPSPAAAADPADGPGTP